MGSGKSIEYWCPFSFDLAFTRCKLTSPDIWKLCNRAVRFKICQEWCGNISTLRKSKRARPNENPPTPTLCAVWNWNLTEMLTSAALDCRPQTGRTSPALRWSVITVKLSGRGGGWQGVIATGILMKTRQNIIFWGHVRSSKRSGRSFCRNI